MKWLARLGVASVYIFLYLPMLVLAILSFNAAPRGAVWQGFSTQWYSKLWEDPAILEALFNSIEIATKAMLLSAVLGLCVGWVMVRGRRPAVRALFSGLTSVPVLLPDIILGLSLLCFLIWISFPLGKMSVVIAHTAFGTAYVAMLVRARLLSMDPLLEEAAADLGASRLTTLGQVILPQLLPALVSGMIMAFTLSFDDFIVAFFTAGVGATTLPLKIYSMLKFGMSPEINVLSVFIIGISFVLVPIAFWGQLTGKKERA